MRCTWPVDSVSEPGERVKWLEVQYCAQHASPCRAAVQQPVTGLFQCAVQCGERFTIVSHSLLEGECTKSFAALRRENETASWAW